MAELDIDALEKRLEEAIACVTAKGWTLAPDLTIERATKSCCPIGAVAVCVDESTFASPWFIAEYYLELKASPAYAFMSGFDGRHSRPSEDYFGRLYALGAKFRAKYVEAKS